MMTLGSQGEHACPLNNFMQQGQVEAFLLPWPAMQLYLRKADEKIFTVNWPACDVEPFPKSG
jgi:hypothetical protein